MFDVGFSEVLLIFVIALVVLGPEKLPRLASQVGRWVGRARAMARQFREQLEEEVNLEQVRKAHTTTPPQTSAPPESQSAGTTDVGSATSQAQPAASDGHPSTAQFGSGAMPNPEDFRADTFSHAHPTNEYGANPLTANGASEAAAPQPAPHAPEQAPGTGAYAGANAPTSSDEPRHS